MLVGKRLPNKSQNSSFSFTSIFRGLEGLMDSHDLQVEKWLKFAKML